jgi:hypothetical protein
MNSEAAKEFEKSCLLWLPDNNPDGQELLNSLRICNSALDDLMMAEISFQDYCDVLATENINMDSYLDTVYDNICLAGF